MAGKSKVKARDIHVQVFSRPATVRNGSGAFVSSVQTIKAAAKPEPAKPRAKKKPKA